MRRALAVLALAAALSTAAPGARAGGEGDLSDFAFRPHPGARLPLSVTLTDEQGRPAALSQFFGAKPVVLVLEYLRCKTLCGVTLEGVVAALDALPVDAGRDFQLLAVDIDPRDGPADAAAAETKYLAAYRHPDAAQGVHFLTGSAASVRAIADAVGFPYQYDAAVDQYVHPAGFVVAAPDGRISRYLYGVGTAAADLRAALAEAAEGRALSPLTRLLLLCHFGGAAPGRYTVPVLAAFTLADLAAGAALIAVFAAIRRRRRR